MVNAGISNIGGINTNSFLNKFTRLFSKLDFIGPEFNFESENSIRHRTVPGAIFSLLTFIVALVITVYFGQEVYHKKSPSVSSSHEYLDYSEIYLKDFPIMFNFYDSYAREITNINQYLDFKVYIFTIAEDSSVSAYYNYTLINCNSQLEYFSNENKNYVEYMLTQTDYTYLCVNFDDSMKFQNSFGSINSTYLQVVMSICVEGTRETCDLSDNFIYTSSMNAAITFVDSYVDSTIYNNPVIKYVNRKVQPLAYGLHKLGNFKVLNNEFISDNGWLLESFEHIRYKEFDELALDVYLMEGSIKYLYVMNIEAPTLRLKTNRSYMKVQELFARVGGIANALFIFISVVTSNFLRFKYLLFIREHTFNMMDKEFIKKQRISSNKLDLKYLNHNNNNNYIRNSFNANNITPNSNVNCNNNENARFNNLTNTLINNINNNNNQFSNSIRNLSENNNDNNNIAINSSLSNYNITNKNKITDKDTNNSNINQNSLFVSPFVHYFSFNNRLNPSIVHNKSNLNDNEDNFEMNNVKNKTSSKSQRYLPNTLNLSNNLREKNNSDDSVNIHENIIKNKDFKLFNNEGEFNRNNNNQINDNIIISNNNNSNNNSNNNIRGFNFYNKSSKYNLPIIDQSNSIIHLKNNNNNRSLLSHNTSNLNINRIRNNNIENNINSVNLYNSNNINNIVNKEGSKLNSKNISNNNNSVKYSSNLHINTQNLKMKRQAIKNFKEDIMTILDGDSKREFKAKENISYIKYFFSQFCFCLLSKETASKYKFEFDRIKKLLDIKTFKHFIMEAYCIHYNSALSELDNNDYTEILKDHNYISENSNNNLIHNNFLTNNGLISELGRNSNDKNEININDKFKNNANNNK